MDVMTPVLDGITVCKMVKRPRARESCPVISMLASERLCKEGRAALRCGRGHP
jgi:CheY-like chemotaxis protein